ERELRDPFDMITQYSKFFTLKKECSRGTIENVDPRKIFARAAAEAEIFFWKAAEVYRSLGMEEKALSAGREAKQITLKREEIIAREEARLNPLGLQRGYLAFRPGIKADLFLNTDRYGPEEVGERALKLAESR